MSTNPRIYLDFNATSPLVGPAREAMVEALAGAGNPSSIHAEGRQARDRVERARNQVAALLGRPREQVVFTSGGTEANAIGVRTLAAAAIERGLPRIVATSTIEHPSLLAAVRSLGWQIRLFEVTADGAMVAPDLTGIGVLAVAAVNHELGTVLDSSVIATGRAAGTLIHVDAVQAAGKRAIDPAAIDADSIAISAHKIGGPQGVGAVALAIEPRGERADVEEEGGGGVGDRARAAREINPRGERADAEEGVGGGVGGHQERGRRGGTENTVGIAGFGAAAAAIDLATWPAVAALGDRLEAGLRAIDDVRIHGANAKRIGGTINAGFAGARGESIVIALDLAGVAVSTGAACTSGTLQPSQVLLALGQTPDQAREAVRFSLGRTTTADEIDRVLALLPAIVKRARR